MVRGRKVRTMESLAVNDDCCSPLPKKRGRRIPIKRELVEPAKPNSTTISAFFQFQTVNGDITTKSNNNRGLIKLNGHKTAKDDIVIATCDNKEDEKKCHVNGVKIEDSVVTKCPATPMRTNGNIARMNRLTPETKPATPHRIELCSEESVKNGIIQDEDNVKVNIKEEVSVEKSPVASKRLNYNNHQVTNAINTKMNLIKNNLNHKLTEYFPVRRSVRKTKKTVLAEKQRSLEQLLRSGSEEGLEVRHFEEKGRGVVAARAFNRGDFVVEYSGDLIDINEAKRRELKYAQDQNAGCYMYYFKYNDQQYCVDATSESGKLGRLVNHSRNGNLLTRTVMVDRKPRLVLIAKDDIKEGEEVTYDYGDRSKESLKHHPWLAY